MLSEIVDPFLCQVIKRFTASKEKQTKKEETQIRRLIDYLPRFPVKTLKKKNGKNKT